MVLHVKFEFHSNLDTLTYFAAKLDQSHLSAFMALKIILRPQIWYTLNEWVSWPLLIFVLLVELPASDTWGLSFTTIRSLPLKSFLDFFLNVLQYQVENCFIHWVGCTAYWVHVSIEWDPCHLHGLSLGTVNKPFTDAGKGRIQQSLTALVFNIL